MPVALIHDLARTVPPFVAAAVALHIAAVVIAWWAVRADRGLRAAGFAAASAGVAGAAIFWPFGPPLIGPRGNALVVIRGLASPATMCCVAIAITAAVVFASSRRRAQQGPGLEGGWGAWRWCGAAWVAAAAILITRLDTYFGTLMVWEGTVVFEFATAVLSRTPILCYLGGRFLWDNGLLSVGNTSLLYGWPAYAAMWWLGFEPWVLRLPSVLATLVAIPLVFLMVRRFYGRVAGAAAAVLFALNPAVLHYGRYGSSPAATMLAVVVAMFVVWLFLDSTRNAWWLGPVAAVALWVATLQYAPGRLYALALAVVAVGVVLSQPRDLTWRRAGGLLLMLAVLGGVYQFERSHQRDGLLLFAQGEQLLYQRSPHGVQRYLGEKVAGGDIDGETTLRLATAMISTTAPQCWALAMPSVYAADSGKGMLEGLLAPLYPGWTWLLVLIGGLTCGLRLRSWRHAGLLALLPMILGPLLLTTRIDTHRVFVLCLPLAILSGIGVAEVASVARGVGVPRRYLSVVAMTLTATLVFGDVALLFDRDPRLPGEAVAVRRLLADLPGSLTVVENLGQTERGWLQLSLLERFRRDHESPARLLPERLRELRLGSNAPSPRLVDRLLRQAWGSAIVLVPAEPYDGLAEALERRGLDAAVIGGSELKAWLVAPQTKPAWRSLAGQAAAMPSTGSRGGFAACTTSVRCWRVGSLPHRRSMWRSSNENRVPGLSTPRRRRLVSTSSGTGTAAMAEPPLVGAATRTPGSSARGGIARWWHEARRPLWLGTSPYERSGLESWH